MPRIQINDVVPKEKRTIRNIPLPHSSKKKIPSMNGININRESDTEPSHSFANNSSVHTETDSQYSDTSESRNLYAHSTSPILRKESLREEYFKGDTGTKKGKGKHLAKILAGIIIIAFIAFMMTLFSSANITLNLKSENVSVDTRFVIPILNGNSDVKSEDIKVSRIESEQVQASGEEMVERKASGKIIVYNNFSSEPQRLITRTRFESKEGKIYRIPESIVVPGKSEKGRGQIEVLVYADEPGEEFNIDNTTFTVPGFKNDPARYTGFGAESSTKIDGGFVGKVKKVEEKDKTDAYRKIDATLEMSLRKELETQVPDGLVLLEGAWAYKSEELAQEDSGSGATLKKEGTLSAIIFDKEDLSRKIFDTNLSSKPDWANIRGEVKDFGNLKIEVRTLETGDIDIHITGDTFIEAYIDEAEIKQKLLGQKRNNVSEILGTYQGILSARASVRPSWKGTFPENPDKIYLKYAE